MASNGSSGSLLFNLHTFLAVHICSKWLYDCDLAALDSAVCNYEFRPILLALLSHNGFTVNMNSHNKNVKLKFLRWAVQRGVSVHQICLENSTIPVLLDSATLRRTKEISVAKADINTIHKMLNTAPLLQNLSVNGMVKRSDFKTDRVGQLKELCSFLSNIEIYNTEKVTSKFITSIDVRKLRRLVVGKCGSVSKGFLNALAGRIRPEAFRVLDLSHLPSLTDSRLALLLKHTPLLASISFEFCKGLGADTYRNIAVNCPQLTSLRLVGSEFEHTLSRSNAEESAALVTLVENCTLLTTIELCGLLSVNDAVLCSVLQGLPQLSVLSIQQCSYLVGASTAALKYSSVPCLVKAEFVLCQGLTGLMRLCELFPTLEQLTVDQCTAMSYAAFNHIFRHGKALRKLRVSHTFRIYGYDLDTIPAENLPRLTELNLVGCRDLVDDGLENIARICPNLQRLQLGMCDSVTSAGIERLVDECTQLRYMGGDTWAVGHTGVLALLQHCPLEGLWVQMSELPGSVTADTLLSMAAMHPPLRSLYLQYFPVEGMCVNALISLLDACPALTKVHLEANDHEDQLAGSCAHLQAYMALLKRAFPERDFACEGAPDFNSFFHLEI